MYTAIGERIKYYRNKRKLSRRELSYNICDESTLFRIEKGQHIPRVDILVNICKKLNIQISCIIGNTEDSNIEELKKNCRYALYKKDFTSLQYFMEEAELICQTSAVLHTKKSLQRFIMWIKGIFYHMRECDLEKAEKTFKSLFKKKVITNELDVNIANSLALVLIEKENFDEAYTCLLNALKFIKNETFINDKSLYPRVKYNMAYIQYKRGNFDLCKQFCYKVQYFLESNHLLYAIGEVKHLLGLLYKRQSQFNEAKKYLEEAATIFSFENRDMDCIQSLLILLDIFNIQQDDQNIQLHIEYLNDRLANIEDNSVLLQIEQKVEDIFNSNIP